MQYKLHRTLFPEVAFFMVFYGSNRRRNESTAHEDSWEAATTQNPTNLCSVYPETLQPNLCSWKSWSDVTGKKFCLSFWNVHSQPPMWIFAFIILWFIFLSHFWWKEKGITSNLALRFEGLGNPGVLSAWVRRCKAGTEQGWPLLLWLKDWKPRGWTWYLFPGTTLTAHS